MAITRREWLKWMSVAASGAALGHAFPRAADRPPNIVMILCDDLGWNDVSFTGKPAWRTPNLDRLAAQGTVYTRWYTAAPICAPSRACLLTGRYTIHNGVTTNGADLPASEVTIARALKDRGYATALVGKWHRGGGNWVHPLDRGFDQTYGYLTAREAWEHFPKTLWRGKAEEPASGFSSDILSGEAIQFIDRNRTRPFFLYLAYIEPHLKIEAPPEDVARFKGKFEEKDPANPLNATYAAMITRLDAGVGRVMAALDKAGLADNTLVVFTSDNGATFEVGNQGTANFHDSNYPFAGQKRTLNEGGIRMPALARWPGRVPAGKKSAAVMHMTDLFPTFLAAAGAQPDPAWQVDGRNMLEALEGKAQPADRTLFWEWRAEGNYEWLAAMRGDLKLLSINGAAFLYDVARDPAERRNVFAEYPEMYRRLQSEVKEWLATARPGLEQKAVGRKQ